MSRRTWAIGVLAMLVAAGTVLYAVTNTTDKHFYRHRAIADAEKIVWGCQAYHKRSGVYPAKLTDLITPPPNGRPLLDDAEHYLTDPWGNPFKYAVVPNERGEPEPYVWTERTVDGRTTLLGAKVTAAGETILFGLPD